MKILYGSLLFLGGFIFSIGLFAIGSFDFFDGRPGTMDDPIASLPTYLSFVSVMLTAVTAVITALGIGIALLAAYSFKEITSKAVAAAEKVTEASRQKLEAEYVEKLSEDNINALILKVTLATKQTPTVRELEEGFDLSDSEDR